MEEDNTVAQERPKAQERLLRSLIDGLPELIYVKDLEGRFLIANTALAKHMGASSPGELIGKCDLDFYPEELSARYAADDQAVLKTGEPVTAKGEPTGARGERWISTTKVALRNEQGGIEGLAGMGRDITAQKRAEEQQRLIIESAPCAMVITDQQGRITLANSETLKYFGYGREELLGQQIEILVPQHLRNNHPRYRQDYLSAPKQMGVGRNLYGRRKDGSEFPVEISLNPVEGPEGPVVISAITDITERQRVQTELRRLSRVFSDATDAIIIEDLDGNLIDMNDEAARAYGWPREELLGRSGKLLVPQERHGESDEMRARCRQRQKVRDVEWLRQTRTGKVIPVLLTLSLLTDEEGLPLGIASLAKDVTELKRAAAELAKAHAELELQVQERTAELAQTVEQLAAANEELDSFVHISSHDLQEPLRTLISFSTMLRNDLGEDLPKEAAEDLHYITDSAHRMQRLVRDLLLLSRAGRAEMRRKLVSLDDCVDESLEALRAGLEESGASVKRDPLPEVAGDRTLLTQIYLNLIGNAIRFGDEKEPIVELTAERIDGFWNLGVRDYGIGLKPEYSEQIFAPFKRLHGRNEYPGSGIGLAICRKAVERHGGKVWVESEPGNGAHFKFTIPADTEPERE